jgi:general secretion pathway protein F
MTLSPSDRSQTAMLPTESSSSMAALRFTAADYALLCRQLKTLIQAGMTIVEAVEALAVTTSRIEASELSQALGQQLRQGLSLSIALERLPNVPAVLVAAVRAGERTSNLVEALDDYLQFDVMVSQLKTKVISAAIYPLLVTALGLGISLFLLIVVMPNFSRMYTSLRSGATGATATVVELSRWINTYQQEVMLTTAVLVGVLVTWAWQQGSLARTLQLLEVIPWIKRKADDFRLAMMYQALALLLKGGFPMVNALSVASQSSLSPDLGDALNQAKAAIERGAPIAPALHDAGLCDGIGKRLMAAAERNGDFHRAAQAVSHIYSERFMVFIERLTRIVEPVLLLAVALLVGTIVVMMYLPVFEIATQLR